MSHVSDDNEFVTAYDTRTGKKLPNKVPRAHLEVFPYLSETPKSRTLAKPTPAPVATDRKRK